MVKALTAFVQMLAECLSQQARHSDEIRNIRKELRKVKETMGKLKGAVQSVADAEAALEAREKAHDARDAANLQHQQEVAAELQKQIDDLTAKLGESDQAVIDLQALKDKMDAFDIDAVAPPPPPPDNPPADGGTGGGP